MFTWCLPFPIQERKVEEKKVAQEVEKKGLNRREPQNTMMMMTITMMIMTMMTTMMTMMAMIKINNYSNEGEDNAPLSMPVLSIC